RYSQNRVVAIGWRGRILRGQVPLVGHAAFIHEGVRQNRSRLQHGVGVGEQYIGWRSRQLSVEGNHLRIFRVEPPAGDRVLRALYVIEIADFLIAVIDRRDAETGLTETCRAGAGEIIAAVVELDVENVERHGIDVRSVARDAGTAERTEVTIAGMI